MTEEHTEQGDQSGLEWNQLPPWMLGGLAALVCLLLYIPTATWDYDQVTDSRATAIAAWSLADHGSIAVDETWPDVPWALQGPDGRHFVWRHPGGIVWSALFYAPTSLGGDPTSAVEVPYGPGTASAVVATALGVGAMVMVFRRIVPARTSFFGGLALGLATSNWSISADAPWNHGPTLLFLALGLLASSHGRHAWSGLSMAAAITVRPHVAVAPAVMGLAAGWRERRTGPVLAMAATSLLGLVAVMWFYGHFFGEASMRPEQVDAFVTGDVNLTDHGWGMNLLLSLVQPTRGLLFYSPFLVLLIPGLRAAWRDGPPWVRASAVSAVFYAAIQTRADVWHAGSGFFGPRAHLETLTLAAPLLLLAYQHYARHRPGWRTAVEVTTIASAIVFAIGSTGLGFLDRGSGHCWTQHYVGVYRPMEEREEQARQSLIECAGLTPAEADDIVYGTADQDGGPRD